MGALFLLGLVLFNPPLLDIFDVGVEATVFGIPLLYAYLFIAWAILIALLVIAVERRARGATTTGADDTLHPED
jgi:hypothetical protein